MGADPGLGESATEKRSYAWSDLMLSQDHTIVDIVLEGLAVRAGIKSMRLKKAPEARLEAGPQNPAGLLLMLNGPQIF